ncbi:MAG: asparagine synthase (glutamine-hydrolyzing) [Firmicutes bacterium]|nr:asparagine synthase (glutamine-hydrolyzing) [Bacillota bacterium]
MCGIAGYCNFKGEFLNSEEYGRNILIKMRESIAHRGNDESGEYLRSHIGLSHTRLSIRDLKNGTQPIVRNFGGKEYAIAYNGEVYNTEELKEELIKKGYEFETSTDTEVILYLYIEYGIESVKMLNGIFAYAIYDESEGRTVLFRDRCGIKPLYYTVFDGTLIFGSEVKALFEYPSFVPEIDIDSMREIIGIGPAISEGCGVFKNVNEVGYGSYIIFTDDGMTEKKYWELESREHTDSYEETTEKVNYLVSSAVNMQMVSDVEVCSFLSGGVDSCIVTALASKYLEKEGKTLNTFSFDFSGNDKYFKSNDFQPERDKPYVEKMLREYKLNHTILECDDEKLFDYLFKVVDARDMPGMADVESSLLYFCSEVKKHNKVTLTGECADEIFGGYPWFHKEEFFNAQTFPWSVNLSERTKLFDEEFVKKLDIEKYVQAKYEKSIKAVPHLYGESKKEAKRREISFLNLKWFMTTLLTRMDRTSMYSGLEARVPYADHRIIEYMWNVPWEYKCPNGVVKGLLRDSFKGVLSDELLYRKKSPYPKTYSPEYERLLKDKLREIVGDSNSPILSVLDKKKTLDFIDSPDNYTKPFFGQLMAKPQLMAYIIQINYWLEKYNLSV